MFLAGYVVLITQHLNGESLKQHGKWHVTEVPRVTHLLLTICRTVITKLFTRFKYASNE